MNADSDCKMHSPPGFISSLLKNKDHILKHVSQRPLQPDPNSTYPVNTSYSFHNLMPLLTPLT